MDRFGKMFRLTLLLLIVCWGTATAAPRFVDKDTALDLAKVLDKGVFRGSLISSTFVQSPVVGDYQIKVVLDNGAELNWSMRQIRQWSQDNSLTLSKNRVLVFPSEENNEFGVLDKNEFTRLALRARVYSKHYKEPDLLSGQVIRYAIHSFNMVELLSLARGHDRRGDLYRYAFDLENGQREFLTYLDAWGTLNKNGLQTEEAGEPVMRVPYRLESIRARKLERNVADGTGRFTVSMEFDRPVMLKAGHFPYRLFERPAGKGKAALDNKFVFEVTAPNAILPARVNEIESLEFLYNITAVTDDSHQNRVLLQAMIAPEVLTSPPEVVVKGNTVAVTFIKVEDQSVFDRKALRDAELRRKQERLLAPTLTPEEVERRKLYRQHMESGVGQLDKARAQRNMFERYEVLQAAMANFKEAALHASSDQELEEALRQRNALGVRLPRMILEYARNAMDTGNIPEKSRLISLLKAAKNLTRDSKILQSLEEARKQVSGN